jgi:hypothetical protein
MTQLYFRFFEWLFFIGFAIFTTVSIIMIIGCISSNTDFMFQYPYMAFTSLISSLYFTEIEK